MMSYTYVIICIYNIIIYIYVYIYTCMYISYSYHCLPAAVALPGSEADEWGEHIGCVVNSMCILTTVAYRYVYLSLSPSLSLSIYIYIYIYIHSTHAGDVKTWLE